MNHFCTIASSDYLYKVQALYQTLLQCCTQPFQLHVLVTDLGGIKKTEHIKFYALSDLANPTALPIILKYRGDKLRWSLKPVFILHLLQHSQKVIYIDNDIAFFNNPEFLFDLLSSNRILLTPHRYSFSPTQNQFWLENNLKFGLYNAGFFAAHSDAKNALEWWAACCLYRCQKNYWRGLYDDQKYLDLLPIIEPSTLILEHKGCNVAGWNIENCPRTSAQNQILAGNYPIVFIHFNFYTIRTILEGNDPLLQPHWQQYFNLLKQYKPTACEADFYQPLSMAGKLKIQLWKWLSKN